LEDTTKYENGLDFQESRVFPINHTKEALSLRSA
jgi:hypothetical protein